MLPEMNCSNTHIKWSLPLLKSQPASCEWQKHICSSVIVNVRVLMITFIKNEVSLTGSFQMPKGVFVQLHWYVQCWLILVKHCCLFECSHLHFCCSSVVVSKWTVHVYAWCMGPSAEDPSLQICVVQSILTCICLMAGVLVKVALPTPNWTSSSWITWQCSYYAHPPQLIAAHPVIRHQHESCDVVLTTRIRRSAANQRASGTSYQ